MDGLNEQELLNYIIKNGIVDLQVIEQKAAMDKRLTFLKNQHKNKMWKAKDKRWKTYGEQNGTRKLIAKATKEELVDYLFDYYRGIMEEQIITFEKVFFKFKEYKSNFVVDNTVLKYEQDYRRFFKGTEFVSRDITTITGEDVSIFIVTRVKELSLKRRAYEALYGYMQSTFQYAKAKKYIPDSPMDGLSRRDYIKFCTVVKKNPKDRIVSSKEMSKIQGRINQDKENHPKYIVPYAVTFASLTGMRVGEIAALKWEDIDFSEKTITIDKAELFNFRTKEYSIGSTKNFVVRIMPMTKKIEQLLEELRQVEERYGYLCEYVFANENGRIHKNSITRCAINKSGQVGLKSKPIHAYRRTLNSNLKFVGVSTATAASMLGHTEDVNNSAYTYDVADMDYKRELLEQIE